MTMEVEDGQPVSREYVFSSSSFYFLLGLLDECINIFRYIGDLEQEIKNLEDQITASETINSLPSTPTPVNIQVSGDTDSQISRREMIPERRERHSSNFVEGGGIR